MSKLRFSMEKLKPIIEHSLNEKEFVAPYGMGDPIPQLYLVKDEGIYLMSGAKKQLLKDGSKQSSVVCYAEGYDPHTDEDVWEASRAAVGGDDFAETIPLDYIAGCMKDGCKWFEITMSAESFRMRGVA